MKKFVVLVSMLFLSEILDCQHVQAMQPPKKKISTIKELLIAAHAAAQDHFDRGNLLVFDGADGANQCHINALMVVKLAHTGIKFADLQDSQRVFLLNNFIRSILLRFEVNDGPKRLESFLKISISPTLLKALRSSQSSTVKEIAHQIITSKEEFFNSSNPPIFWADFGFNDERLNRCILPKFVGIKFLLNQVSEAGIWMVLKCKALSEQGQQIATFLISPDQHEFFHIPKNTELDCFSMHGLDQSMPVIVIEGHAWLEPSSNNFDEHCQRVSLLNPGDLQLAIAAAWMQKNQPVAREILSTVGLDHESWEERARCLNVYTEKNETLFIFHMFPDVLKNAVFRDRLITPERGEQMSDDEIKKFVWQPE